MSPNIDIKLIFFFKFLGFLTPRIEEKDLNIFTDHSTTFDQKLLIGPLSLINHSKTRNAKYISTDISGNFLIIFLHIQLLLSFSRCLSFASH